MAVDRREPRAKVEAVIATSEVVIPAGQSRQVYGWTVWNNTAGGRKVAIDTTPPRFSWRTGPSVVGWTPPADEEQRRKNKRKAQRRARRENR